jgi:NAD(P)-dependent dehydrogenase (short-subunit alcohol dehydrogenase family)
MTTRDLSASGAFVILGAAGGIGSAIARSLAADGARLVLAGRNLDRLQPLATELGATAHTVDAADFAAVEGLVAQAAADHGKVAGIVNAVGSILLKPAHLTSEQELAETLRLNVQTAFAAVRAAGRTMTAGGSVLLFSSSASEVGLPNHEAIAAAKGAVGGLVRSAAATYAARHLRVNAIAPGFTLTEASLSVMDDAETYGVSSRAIPRASQPGDMVGTALFLASEDASYITGQTIIVDGGKEFI